MRAALLSLPVFALTLALPVFSAPVLPVTPADAAVIHVPFVDSGIVRVRVKVGIVTRILLGADEHIEVAATGVSADCEALKHAWCIRADKGTSIIWVRPRPGARSNNLELRSDRHDYSFVFEVVEDKVVRNKRGRVIGRVLARPHHRVTFEYNEPVTTKAPIATSSAPSPPAAQSEAPVVVNRRYLFEPNKVGKGITPVDMFDDGCFTFIRFSARAELPIIFRVNADGQEQRLGMQIRDGVVVLHEVAPGFVIRLGGGVVKVVNAGLGQSPLNSKCTLSARPGLVEEGVGDDG